MIWKHESDLVCGALGCLLRLSTLFLPLRIGLLDQSPADPCGGRNEDAPDEKAACSPVCCDHRCFDDRVVQDKRRIGIILDPAFSAIRSSLGHGSHQKDDTQYRYRSTGSLVSGELSRCLSCGYQHQSSRTYYRSINR